MPDLPEFVDERERGEFHLARAEARIVAQDYPGALADFKAAQEALGEDDPRAAFGITMAMLALQEEARAQAAAARLAENPGDLDAAVRMADALRRNGKVQESLTALRQALAIAPAHPRLHFELALTLSCWAKDREEAQRHFDEALRLKSDYTEALRFRAINRREMGEHDRAIDDFSRLLDLAPDDRNVYENRALAYEGLGDWGRAEADYSRVLEGAPENHFYLTRRGLCRLVLDEPEAAIADFDRALALRAKEAMSWYDPAEDEEPDTNPDPEALRGRAVAHVRLGNLEAARRDFQAAYEAFDRYRGKDAEKQEILTHLAELPTAEA